MYCVLFEKSVCWASKLGHTGTHPLFYLTLSDKRPPGSSRGLPVIGIFHTESEFFIMARHGIRKTSWTYFREPLIWTSFKVKILQMASQKLLTSKLNNTDNIPTYWDLNWRNNGGRIYARNIIIMYYKLILWSGKKKWISNYKISISSK